MPSNEVGFAPYDAGGQPLCTAQLDRPLDFAMVSDHAEFFGDRALCTNPATVAYSSYTCQLYRAQDFWTVTLFSLNLTSPQNNTTQMAHCGWWGSECWNHAITLWQKEQKQSNYFDQLQKLRQQYYAQVPGHESIVAAQFPGYLLNEWL